MDGGAWWAAVHGVAKSQTQLSDFIFTFHFYALEKEMATHSSVLAWRIPWTEKPGRLQSRGSHRVRHNWSDVAAASQQVFNPFFKNNFVYLFSFACAGSSCCVDILSSWGAQSSHCRGFFCCGTPSLVLWASVITPQAPQHRLSSCGAWA